VLDAEGRAIGVVVEKQQFASPPHPHLIPGAPVFDSPRDSQSARSVIP
jgi:hypothetical protein